MFASRLTGLIRSRVRLLSISLGVLIAFTAAATAAEKQTAGGYRDLVLKDSPVGYWRFDGPKSNSVRSAAKANGRNVRLDGGVVGRVSLQQNGPRSKEFPLFAPGNRAGRFPQSGGFLRVVDPGKNSPLDFTAGDSITLEAWVKPQSLAGGGFHYIIGKGRTGNRGFALNNQNYALRLKAPAGALSFLFRSAGKTGEWHRWTSSLGVSADGSWHHVAVTYTFGRKDSVRGYIDGEPVQGVWDMGGATGRAPVVDDDELRIGSSFHGLIDEVALYRQALSAARIRARYRAVLLPWKAVEWDKVPRGRVLVEIFEGIPDRKSWKFRPPRYVESFTTPAFAFIDVPKKYNNRGILIDRSNPFLIRAVGKIRIPAGPQRLLLRARNGARLYLDGRKIAETPFHNIRSTAHGTVYPVDTSLAPNIRPLQRGDREVVVNVSGDGKLHRVRFEMIVGGRGRRPELGESSVSIAAPGADFRLLSESETVSLTDEDWRQYVLSQRRVMAELNTQHRRNSDPAERKYWRQRHRLAAAVVKNRPQLKLPKVADHFPLHNVIDRFIGARLQTAGRKPAPLLNDLAFLRRVTLDVIGTVPTPAQIAAFLRLPKSKRRTRVIETLLNDPGWADNWMGYWQDVLAENPNLIKPKLNNSGPFRWWMYESFLDNKPFDRFVTELVRMEGSKHFGGPAGFGIATQNDVPMAAKAQILGRAFLGLNMTCARCHDAPYHDFLQKDLFSLAAMLNRSPLRVPKTSSIPGGDAAVSSLIVEVTLKPGSLVKPAWTFPEVIGAKEIPAALRAARDSRERLAALITSPRNRRFARVIVNRLWKRYLGRGLVEPVDDWHDVKPSHPGLLDFLAREFVRNGYDLKQVARLILNSHVYQRRPQCAEDVKNEKPYLFAGPILRRMSAEQLVDSLFSVAGKSFDAGPMCLDIDSSLSLKTAMNLHEPTRSWQFASLSNERDRPSLALPFAQPFVTTLKTFGWRSARQNPITQRDEKPTVLQPAVMANSLLARRINLLSDDNAFTKMALESQPVEQLIDRVYLRMLTRKPTASERKLFVELLSNGYSQRRVKNPKPPAKKKPLPRGLVGWSNHLHSRANEIKIELQRAVERGDTPTNRLDSDWRQRMEDMVWTLMNSPEFVYL
ncbi:MAG: DUF1553 domain-containing protein, partial [Planctomycetes bacterium]|nr:DUF1553 domain-containing protein [Planctomycetota bacterium]